MKSVYFQKSGIQTPSNLKCIVSYVLKYGFGKGNTLYGFQANILGENRLRNNKFAPKNCIISLLRCRSFRQFSPLLLLHIVILMLNGNFMAQHQYSALDILI